MRTTVTLDPDVDALVRRLMRERKLTFKQAINQAVRESLISEPVNAFETRATPMGAPSVPLDHALRLAAELEDEELAPRRHRHVRPRPRPLHRCPCSHALTPRAGPGR